MLRTRRSEGRKQLKLVDTERKGFIMQKKGKRRKRGVEEKFFKMMGKR